MTDRPAKAAALEARLERLMAAYRDLTAEAAALADLAHTAAKLDSPETRARFAALAEAYETRKAAVVAEDAALTQDLAALGISLPRRQGD